MPLSARLSGVTLVTQPEHAGDGLGVLHFFLSSPFQRPSNSAGYETYFNDFVSFRLGDSSFQSARQKIDMVSATNPGLA